MKRLHELINPSVNFCRMFGLGLLYSKEYIKYLYDAFLLLINIFVFVYCYFHVTSFISTEMNELWNITTVISVIRLYISLLAPPLMVLLSQFKKQTLTKILNELDKLVPSIDIVFLRSYLWYSVKWLLLNIIGDIVAFTTFILRTNFQTVYIKDFILISISNCWLYIPIFQYLFIIKTIHFGMQKINIEIHSMGDWKLFREKWKDLRFLAIHLTNSVYGEIILLHIICHLAGIIFILFVCYFHGYKPDNNIVTFLLIVKAIIGVIWLFELFKQCQNCKFEVTNNHYRLNHIFL